MNNNDTFKSMIMKFKDGSNRDIGDEYSNWVLKIDLTFKPSLFSLKTIFRRKLLVQEIDFRLRCLYTYSFMIIHVRHNMEI